MEQTQLGIEELQEENKVLKRNIKRAKQVLVEKEERIKAKQRREIEREKGGAGGRNSDIDSNSLKDADGHSMASFSALGGYGVTKIDIKKVELINQNIKEVLLSKNPLDTMLAVIKTFKQAFKQVARCTIFVMNRYLQAYVFKAQTDYKKYFKAIQMGSRHNIVYAIYQD